MHTAVLGFILLSTHAHAFIHTLQVPIGCPCSSVISAHQQEHCIHYLARLFFILVLQKYESVKTWTGGGPPVGEGTDSGGDDGGGKKKKVTVPRGLPLLEELYGQAVAVETHAVVASSKYTKTLGASSSDAGTPGPHKRKQTGRVRAEAGTGTTSPADAVLRYVTNIN